MKISPDQQNHIREAFAVMTGQQDFLDLLNYTKRIIYERAVPFTMRHLTYHSNPAFNTNRYKSFTIKKKSGGDRAIHTPNTGLKLIQKCLNIILQAVYEPHSAANGFIPGRSIVSNAEKHTGKNYVYNIDLKDFFPSIDQARVWGRLKHPPFNLNEQTGRLVIANRIASICCQEMEVERKNEAGEWALCRRNVLPQGAPTSPFMTNIICQSLDFYLSAMAKKYNLNYTRYADDITFSSMHNVYQDGSPVLAELKRIISTQRFDIKESKTRLQKQGYRQEVTGLLVNDKVNVHRRMIKQVRQWLFFWEKFGYEKASTYYLSAYTNDKGHTKKGKPALINVLGGKLDFIQMVKGANNDTYKVLFKRYRLLVKKHYYNSMDRSEMLDEVVEKILTQNLAVAMQGYSKKN